MKTLRTVLYAALLAVAVYASTRQPHQTTSMAQQDPIPTCPIDPNACNAK